jgi:hypothetical protein
VEEWRSPVQPPISASPPPPPPLPLPPTPAITAGLGGFSLVVSGAEASGAALEAVERSAEMAAGLIWAGLGSRTSLVASLGCGVRLLGLSLIAARNPSRTTCLA